MLEVARALIYRPSLLRVPLVFLWTGGEEPFSPVGGLKTDLTLNPTRGAPTSP